MTTWTVPKGALPYRQAQTLAGIAAGKTNKEMAAEAGVKPATIEQAVTTLFYRLRIVKGRRAVLVAEAIRTGLLQSVSLLLLVAITLQAATGGDIERPTRRQSGIRTLRIVKTGRKTGRCWDDLIIPGLGDVA